MSAYFNRLIERRNNNGWFRIGRFDVTTVDILVSLAVLSMFFYGLAGIGRFDRLIFSTGGVRGGDIWQIVTGNIATPPALFPIIGLVFFWSLGQEMERMFGRDRFLVWVLAVAIVPTSIMVALSYLGSTFAVAGIPVGLSDHLLASFWVYAATYPQARWLGSIPLWGAAAGFTVLSLLQLSGIGLFGNVVLLLIVVGVSLVVARSLGLATGWPIPHVDLSSVGSGSSSSSRNSASRGRKRKPKRSKSSGGMKVVDGPWQNAPAPTAPPVGPSPADQAELDGLLDKIGETGMESLSGGEKKRLNELSKRLRNK